MPVVNSSKCNTDWTAEEFKLLSVDGSFYSLDELENNTNEQLDQSVYKDD